MPSPDRDPEADEAGAVTGHESLLPSLSLSVLSSRSLAASEPAPEPGLGEPAGPPPGPAPAPDGGPAEPGAPTADDGARPPRGARTGDVVGGRYVVEGALGRGGMGRVLRVRHQALGKPFALKVIRAPIATNPKVREMFYREARLASALNHDHVCSVVDFGQDDAFGLFMVMELLDGQTVHAKLRQGRLAPKVACDVMWQVADAVRYIHGRAIIHGDLKSENLFLVRASGQRRFVKLLDFGLARADAGRAGAVDGTPEYLAPERIAGGPATQASDIYALGILFFELLTGRLPFTGSLAEVFRQHAEATVPAPSSCVDDALDERADEIVARATAKAPGDRHPDVAALLYELRTLMGMLGMEGGGAARRRSVPADGLRERRELDHRLKAAAEVFAAVPLPMAACDAAGKVRLANAAFLDFLGVAGDAAGLALRDSALPEVYPELLADLAACVARQHPVKRVLRLHDGAGGIVEAAAVLSPAPASAEVTAGEAHLVLHPLRTLPA